MDAVLLDTHVALWLDSGSTQLRLATRAAIDACWHNGGKVLLSSISAWEIALLVDGGRIELDVPVAAWNRRFLDRPGVEAAAVSHNAACRSYQFHQLEHRDPADRLLIATAIELTCPLVTYDERIVRFATRYGRQYGFTVIN
jgi:PIN domain nuclease of toxin-antitoxin system